MATKTYQELVTDGLWTNNPALVQLLGLCPLLAVTSSVVNAIGLSIATVLVLVGSNLAVSLIRNYVSEAVRLPAFVMIIASFTTCAQLLMEAYTYDLYKTLGIFIPLIVTNCAILGRADAFARKNPVLPSLVDGLMMGLGFSLVLITLGAIRELVGQGVLFGGMDQLLGDMAKDWKWVVFEDYPQFLFAILPPGAFVAMGLLIAAKNVIDERQEQRKAKQQPESPKESRRVRVTG